MRQTCVTSFEHVGVPHHFPFKDLMMYSGTIRASVLDNDISESILFQSHGPNYILEKCHFIHTNGSA